MFFTIRSTKRRAASRTQAGKRTILAAPRQLMTDRRSIQAAPRQLMTDRRSIQAASRQLFFDYRRIHIAPFTTSALHQVHSLVFYTFNAVEGAISYKVCQLTCDKGAKFPTVLPSLIINTFIFSVAAPFSSVRRSILPAAVLLPFRRRSVLRKICP